MQGGFGHTVPGTYNFFFSADYSNLTDPPNNVRVDLTNSVTLVAVTNVTVSTNHLAYGTNLVTLTAEMTAAGGGEFVSWETTQDSPGGQFTTTQGLTTGFLPTAGGGVYTIRAICGSSSATVEIHVYELTEVTASPSIVPAGDPVTFTATVVPAGCPLPITWNVSSDTGLCITNTFAAGYHTVTASLGSTEASCTSTNVRISAIHYERTPGDWTELGDDFEFPSGVSIALRAIPFPADADFPANMPVWSGLAAGTGPTASASIPEASEDENHREHVIATCAAVVDKAVAPFKLVTILSFGVEAPPITAQRRSEFGVGESVTLKVFSAPINAPQPGVWLWSTAENNPAIFNGKHEQREATLTCPYVAGEYVVTLKYWPRDLPNAVQTLTKALTIKIPTIQFHVVPAPTIPFNSATDVFHVQGKYSVGFLANITVSPKSVAWDHLVVKETTQQAGVGTGWFAPIDGYIHAGNPAEFGVRKPFVANGESEWFVNLQDTVQIGALQENNPLPNSDPNNPNSCAVLPPYQDGEFVWEIPWLYKLSSNARGEQWVQFEPVVIQKFICNAAGTATATKGAATASKELNAPNSQANRFN